MAVDYRSEAAKLISAAYQSWRNGGEPEATCESSKVRDFDRMLHELNVQMNQYHPKEIWYLTRTDGMSGNGNLVLVRGYMGEREKTS